MASPPSLQKVRTLPRLKRRRRDAHKGDFGRVLVVGGSVGMAGAAALAANAALRGGAGLVKVACPAPVLGTITSVAPCATSVSLPADAQGRIASRASDVLLKAAAEHDVLAVGPGMGQSAGLVTLLRKLISGAEKPMVVDADGLNNLARISRRTPARCGVCWTARRLTAT
jgi:ADP-dependent NAD(P)H-hydrate dehydratase